MSRSWTERRSNGLRGWLLSTREVSGSRGRWEGRVRAHLSCYYTGILRGTGGRMEKVSDCRGEGGGGEEVRALWGRRGGKVEKKW